jgi:hypothetical protein
MRIKSTILPQSSIKAKEDKETTPQPSPKRKKQGRSEVRKVE